MTTTYAPADLGRHDSTSIAAHLMNCPDDLTVRLGRERAHLALGSELITRRCYAQRNGGDFAPNPAIGRHRKEIQS